MQSRHDELRDELVAILGASRELTPDVDQQLADAFLRALEQAREPERQPLKPPARLHQPHYSLQIAGGAWGAVLMFLLCGLIWARPSADQFMGVAVIGLVVVAVATRTFLYLARHDWQLPHLRLVFPPASGTEDRR
jgi:hypothetical protein